MAVELYIVRHAIAAERGPDWPDDDKRPLTERGIDRFKEVVAGLVFLDVQIDLIFTSPLLRARQTAEYLSEGMPGDIPVGTADALAPGHTSLEVMEQIAREAGGAARVAIVGHEPGLGALAGWLIGARRALPFKKGGVCKFEMDSLSSRYATLSWHMPPKALRKLGQ
jgi:phosphohistidine phosphatase